MATILIVDDDSVDRELATRCLEPLEHLEIIEARDGMEALESLSRGTPNLVLTDLRMPELDGLELTERIREEYPLVPVILMTSKGNEQIAVRALETGAASYVPKSDLKDTLAETVEQVLEMAESRRSQDEIIKYLGGCETRFELANDPGLISPMVSFLRDSLGRLGFGNAVIRTQIGMALMEAVSNAMIHGNLEVSSDVREDSMLRYHELIEERRHEDPYAGRRVSCIAREKPDSVDYVVLDEGPGFDPSVLPDPTSPENLTRVRGRGILLIRTFMDRVEFNPKGNQITMTKRGDGSTAG